jgi:hypothetical protein
MEAHTNQYGGTMKLATLALFCAAALTSTAALAETTFSFTGEVTDSGIDTMPVGTIVTGQFHYDVTAAPDHTAESEDGAQFAWYSVMQPGVFQATVGSTQIKGDYLGVDIANNFNGNVEDTANISGSALTVGDQFWESGSMGIWMGTAPGNRSVFNSTALPESFDLAAFDAYGSNYGYLQDGGGPLDHRLYFTLTSITSVTSVPEVSSMVMTALGLAAMGGLMGGRRTAR